MHMKKEDKNLKGGVYFLDLNNDYKYLVEVDTNNKSILPYMVNEVN